jgi:hypothetical protein
MDMVSPTGSGGWGHIAYFFADNIHINGYYAYARMNYSEAFRSGMVLNPATPNGAFHSADRWNNIQHIIVNLMYDVNPAVRLGLEWANINTNYAGYGSDTAASGGANTTPYERKGSVNSFRVGAFYFF